MLNFTIETEKGGCLPFLDMRIHNVNGSLFFNWYRKPIDTGLTLNFRSLARLEYNRSVIIHFVRRIFIACFSWQNIHSGLEEATQILIKYQYPLRSIEELVQKTLYNILDKKNEDSAKNFSLDVTVDPDAFVHTIDDRDRF